MIYFWWYIGISLGFDLIITLILLGQDIHRYYNPDKYRGEKFGFNFSISESALGWFITIALLPFINLLFITLILFNWVMVIRRKIEDKLNALANYDTEEETR